jgi:O-antigen/teichoic acid export membrane protein
MDIRKFDSIINRFIASFIANFFKSVITFITSILLARWLGPEDFGRMAFLLATFAAFRILLDMASTAAFFTFLSQRQRSKQFINFFWCWVLIQFVFSLLVVGILLPESILIFVWKGEGKLIIILALVAVFMQHNVWKIASQMAEAQRETIRLQKLNVVIVLVHLSVIVILWFGGKLYLPFIFVALAIEWLFAGWVASKMYRGYDQRIDEVIENRDTATSVFKEFWGYCKPFIPYAWLSFAYEIGDRWMLQSWGGSSEQAFYTVAGLFAAVVLIATTSILRIFWKEIAEAKYQGDMKRVYYLYKGVSKSLYFFGVVGAGALMPWVDEIINFLLGAAYLDGKTTLMLMFLYPIHQSMGQVGATILYATEHGRIQVSVGMIFMVLSMIMAYFMLAPESMILPGLGLGSEGLAIKMLVIQLIQVNVIAWYISKIFNWRFEWFYQLTSLIFVIAVGWIAKVIIVSIISYHFFIMIILSWLVYLIIISLVVFKFPWLIGIQRKEIQRYLRKNINS